ncbi:truncated TraD [Escherichia coli]|uniref:Truncated TraD n=1 Tax=Escherichia coli TaxID=562 RepID=A0A376MNP7_ECOLX|nr:truncated TraD [Escherichia coli]
MRNRENDSACALVTFGQGIAPVSRVLGDTQAAVLNEGLPLVNAKRVYRKRKLTAVCSHQTRIGNLDAHLI